ncbi:hypothetical protein PSTT_14883 [Puccinia striiformis]|uniref:Uncharacterized protein n=1 Tax=Puccinia striiformis TaxID=27350 RepID=A0A2S4UKK6_9BASI|nr:hypothetical protein PSTT_14883 [Puccinia striiformis]
MLALVPNLVPFNTTPPHIAWQDTRKLPPTLRFKLPEKRCDFPYYPVWVCYSWSRSQPFIATGRATTVSLNLARSMVYVEGYMRKAMREIGIYPDPLLPTLTTCFAGPSKVRAATSAASMSAWAPTSPR